MHIAESNFSNFVIEYLGKIRGSDGFESWKKIKDENLDMLNSPYVNRTVTSLT